MDIHGFEWTGRWAIPLQTMDGQGEQTTISRSSRSSATASDTSSCNRIPRRSSTEDQGVERSARSKVDVSKLKELGLTESLEVGYRLSPRGRAALRRHERRREPMFREPLAGERSAPETEVAMETEPDEIDRSEKERDRGDDLTDTPVETAGEPEQRVDEREPSELEDPESQGEGPSAADTDRGGR